MNEIVFSLMRHGLTAFGGTLVSKGLTTSDDVSTAAGAIVTLAGVVWSIVSKMLAKEDQ
jgi:hypothetical protein